MRILYLADIRFPLERANGIQTMQTCHALAQRGHRVCLLVRPDIHNTARDPFSFYGLPYDPGVLIAHAPALAPPALRRLAYVGSAVVRALQGRAWDVVLTRDLGVADTLLRAPAGWRPPVVYESHGFSPTVGATIPALLAGARSARRIKQRRLTRREERVWERADGYITITATLAGELAARFGARDRVVAIPDGVQLAGRPPFRAPERRDAPVVGYAGHLYPWKGADVLVDALALLPRVHGLIVGGHPAESDLSRIRARAEQLGLSNRVTFVGLVEPPRVPTFLDQADVLVLPNAATELARSSTSPLKLFEYLAAGKPIVASDLPSVREVLRDGENALLVQAGDPGALASGIKRALEDRALAERIARRAYEDAREYGWDRRAARLEQVLQQARN